MAIHEEEVLGKAYDARLMKRLLGYLHAYRWQVAVALVAIVLKAGVDVLGPYLTKVAVDKYLANRTEAHSLLDRFLSPRPLTGIAQIALLYVGLLLFSFLLEFAQTYIMQWTGQKVMFDLRSQIFRHLQRLHISFFDRNPVGRLVTRVTTDVDALNEMFTAGVVSIFEDVFVLLGILAIMLNMNWRLALITFAVLPVIFYATSLFRRAVRESYRRIRVAIARINAYLQEHVTGIVVLQLFNREQRSYEEFAKINRVHMDAYKDAIQAHAIYYPVVEVLSSIAIACVIWFGGNQVLRNFVTLGVLVAFIQYAQRFFRPIQDLSEKYNILQSAMASSERVFKLLDTPPAIVSPAKPKVPQGPGRIEFDHVWFAYRTMAQAAAEAASKGEKLKDGRRQRMSSIGCYATCRSPSTRARRSPLSATPARARPRSSRCCCAFTMCSAAPSASTASIFATWTSAICGAATAWCCRTRSCSAAPSRATSAWAHAGLKTRWWRTRPSRSMSPSSSARCPGALPKR